jgi:multidrug efflux pump
MTLIRGAFARSRLVIAAMLLIVIAGTMALVDIAKEAEPDVNIPIIYVSLRHDGISPEDAERLLIRPMEIELRRIEGVKEMRAKGFEGGAYLLLEFDAGFDADGALQDVRDKVDQAKPELPEDTEEPVVSEVNFSLFPVVVVALSGDVPERTLLRLTRDLRDKVETLPNVLEALVVGDREEVVEVIIDPIAVESYRLTPQQAVDMVRNSNLLVAAGAQDTGSGRFSIKVPGLLETAGDIMALPVRVEGEAVVRVGDIAEVRRTFKDAEGFARVNGRPALALEVSKRSGRNLIETVAQVKAIVERERAAWPAELGNAVHVSFLQDKSDEIRTMLDDLANNFVFASLLVMVVTVAVLGPRSSLLVGLAIPTSFLAAILVLAGLGLTMNIVVLFSLILAVGMLVDGATIVVEYADRKMLEGEPRSKAFALAARRMAWPVISSITTTLAAFLPLLLWPGVVGEFMKFLPITLVATLTASLVTALVFVPTVGALIGKPGAADARTMRSLAGSERGDLSDIGGFTGHYVRLLQRALDHRRTVLASAIALMIGIQVVYSTFGAGMQFFPDVEPDIAVLQVRARGNLSIHEQDAILRQVEQRIFGIADIESVYARTGRPEKSEEAEDIIGTITLEFTFWERRRPARQVLADIRQRTADIPGVFIDARKQEAGPPIGKPIQVELASRYPDLLPAAVERALEGVAGVGGVINVEDGRPLPGIDWELKVDRGQAAKFGADVNQVGLAVQLVTNGIKLGEYRPNDSDDEIDIRVRYPRADRTIDMLYGMRVNTADGPVPIGNFVEIKAQPRVGAIHRVDSRRVMTIKADVAEGVLADNKVREMSEWLASADLDPRIEYRFKGEDEEQKKAQDFIVKAFAMAVLLIAVILVAQFNSFYSTFLVLTAVAMSTIGVFLGLLVTGQSFSIVMGGIAVVALAGIVVGNNIVLIDTYDRLAKISRTPVEAVLRTGAQRLRPVMLTTVTTVLGVLPLMFGVNIDFLERHVTVGAPAAQWWTQLSTAIVFGLSFATVLTLIVTPCALLLRADVSGWLRRGKEREDTAADLRRAAE